MRARFPSFVFVFGAALLYASSSAAAGPQRVVDQLPPDTSAPAHPAQPQSDAPPAPQQPMHPAAPAQTIPAPAPGSAAPQPVPGQVNHVFTSPAAPATGTRAKKRPIRGKRGEPEPQAIMTPPPPVSIPPTPQQMPPSRPVVTYRGGQLTISANNSTLSDVLAAVRARTGATVDIPPGASSDRVYAQIGPAAPRDVMYALLNGSRFNYVIVGSQENPAALAQVIVSQRMGDGAPGPQPGAAQSAQPPQTGGLTPEQAEEAEQQGAAEEQPAPPQPAPQQQAPPQPGRQLPGFSGGAPNQQPGSGAATPTNPNAQPSGQAPVQGQQVKTPEQLLEELKRMQQQSGQQPPTQPQKPPR